LASLAGFYPATAFPIVTTARLLSKKWKEYSVQNAGETLFTKKQKPAKAFTVALIGPPATLRLGESLII